MKINEKNLCNFAVCKSPVDKEGWLNKKGEVYKTFQRRWFVLKGNLLFYFDKREDKEPLGVIILEGGTVELAEAEDVHAFKLVFHGASCRTYILSANDQDSTEEWMKALATASYDYIKLMVAELQRQLSDIIESEKRDIENSLINLPSNSSDSCLYAYGQSSKNQRFNPFDNWNSNACSTSDLDNNMQILRISGASSDSNIAKCDTQPSETNSSRSAYTFLELHEYYGQIFRRVFEENRKKREDSNEKQLIFFD